MSTSTKPSPRVPIPQAVAACTAFAAFAVAIFSGVLASNPTEVVLLRAIVALAAGFAGGFFVGLVCDWLVAQEVRRIESSMDSGGGGSDGAGLAGPDGMPDGEGASFGDDPAESAAADLASRDVRSENRDAAERRREKNAA